ncbi:MAG: SDR family NAD(P)-dependent oxidoreductase [Methylovirgula sp.]
MTAPRPVTLVTGASGGIGADLARVFASHGHDLMLVARSADRLEALADEIAATGRPRPLVLPCDLTSPDAVDKIAAFLEATGAVPDILVNNAGYGLLGDVADLDPAAQLGIVDLNVRAVVALTLRLLPGLRARKGKILNVASVVAFFPGPGMAIYYASKAFLLSFGQALSEELGSYGCTVTTLCPGVTTTDFQARAGFTPDLGIMKFGTASSGAVAATGYAALMAGRRVAIHGLANRILCFFAPLTPSAILLPVIAVMQKKKVGKL